MKEISIKLSKRNTLLLLVGAMTFIAVSIWLWNYSNVQVQFSPVIVKFIAAIGVLFFTICLMFGVVKLFDNKPGLIINDQGIVNNTLGLNSQIIRWNNVKRLEVIKIKNTKILLVFTDNPSEVIEGANIWSKFFMQQNMKWYGTPISITATMLECNFEELLSYIKQYINVEIFNS
jgi:hypothetical protein